MDLNNCVEFMSSGNFVRNLTIFSKSISIKISLYKLSIPNAVRNRNSSLSRKYTSQTRLTTSNGNDLLNNVKILKFK